MPLSYTIGFRDDQITSNEFTSYEAASRYCNRLMILWPHKASELYVRKQRKDDMPEDYRATLSPAAQYGGTQPASAPFPTNGALQELPSTVVLSSQENVLALLAERLGILLNRLENSVLRPPYPSPPTRQQEKEQPKEQRSVLFARLENMTHVLSLFIARVDDALSRLEV